MGLGGLNKSSHFKKNFKTTYSHFECFQKGTSKQVGFCIQHGRAQIVTEGFHNSQSSLWHRIEIQFLVLMFVQV